MSELSKALDVAAEFQNKARRLEKHLHAMSYITGFPVSVITDALELCDKYRVDFELATEGYDFRQTYSVPLDEYRALMTEIGTYVTDVANTNFHEATGVEDFFEVNGADTTSFWISCTDSHEECLRELLQHHPEFVNKLNATTSVLVGEMCQACEIDLERAGKTFHR